MSCDFDVLKTMIEDAISELYRDNWFFFTHGVGEWTISSEFHHIMKMKYRSSFPWLDMDAEYNLMGTINHGLAHKMVVDEAGNRLKIRPDFIIHKRGCSSENILCVEIKRHGGPRLEYDCKKLKYLTRMSDMTDLACVHNYLFGVSVLMLKRRVECRWYERGEIAGTRHASVDVKHNVPFLVWH